MKKLVSYQNVYVALVGCVLMLLAMYAMVSADTLPTSVTVTTAGGNAPAISSLSLNGGSDITLIEGTTKTAATTFTVTDADGCDDVVNSGNVTTTVYRVSTSTNGTTCTANDNNCYIAVCTVATSTNGCTPPSDTSVAYACTVDLQYHTDPTDVGAPFGGDVWAVSATATDASANSDTATNTGETVEVNTLLAHEITNPAPPVIAYGSLAPGANTGVDNGSTTVRNTGNTALDTEVSGNNMCTDFPTCAGSLISVAQQKYGLADVGYASLPYTLSGTASTVYTSISKPTDTTTARQDDLFWGIEIPGVQSQGVYTGKNLLTAVVDGGKDPLEYSLEYLFMDGADLRWHKIGGAGSVIINNSGSPTLEGTTRSVVRTSSGDIYTFTEDSGSCEVWKSDDDGATWAEVDSANNPACASSNAYANIAVDGSDDLHLVYRDDGVSKAIKYQTVDTATDTFGTEESVLTVTDQPFDITLVVDSNDVPHVAYRYLDFMTFTAYAEYVNRVGGSWQTPVVVESGGSVSPTYTSLAIDEDDIPEVAYIEGTADDITVAVGNQNDATSFTLHDVDAGVAEPSKPTSIVVDASGNTWVAYIDDVGGSEYITLAMRNDGSETSMWSSGWSTTTNSNVGSQLSMTADGDEIYVFYKDDNSDVVYDTYTGSWEGETVLETGTFSFPQAKWQFYNNN